MKKLPSPGELEKTFDAAGKSHHDYQSVILNGKNDEQWPGWYSAYVLGRLGDFTSPNQLSILLADAPSSDNWSRSAAKFVLSRIQ